MCNRKTICKCLESSLPLTCSVKDLLTSPYLVKGFSGTFLSHTPLSRRWSCTYSTLPPALGSSMQEIQTYCRHSKGPKRWWRDWGISHMLRCFRLEMRRLWEILSMYIKTWIYRQVKLGSFQPCPKTMGPNWNTGDSLGTSGNTFFTVSGAKHCHRLPIETEKLEILKSNLAMALGNQLKLRGLDQMTARGFFQAH